MNLKNYIESGIIESYLLGLASPTEERELLYLRQECPLLEVEIAKVEIRLESKLLAKAIFLPSTLKNKILQRIKCHLQK